MSGISVGNVKPTKETAAEVLAEFDAVMARVGVPFVLDGGTLLGAVRNGDFCDDDQDDIDLTTTADWESALPLVQVAAAGAGFEYYRCWQGGDDRTAQLSVKKRGVKVDLMFKRRKGNEAWWTVYRGEKPTWKAVKADHFFCGREDAVLRGIRYPIPAHVWSYLEARYGEWEVPVHRSQWSCFSSDECIRSGMDEIGIVKVGMGITFGAFDPIHHGHMELFRRAKMRCNMLVVAVSDGKWIRGRKGRDERFGLRDRIRSLKAISHVDRVVVQSDDPTAGKDKAGWVKAMKPDVMFVGDDWNPGTFGGEGLGVPVVYLPRTGGVSSTELAGNV